MTDSSLYGTVVSYDAAPVMGRVARVTALTILTLLALLVLAVAVAVIGPMGAALFGAGALLVVPEDLIARRRRS